MVFRKAGWKGHPYHAGQLGRIWQELYCSNPSCAILGGFQINAERRKDAIRSVEESGLTRPAGWKRLPQATCHEQGTQRKGCLRAEILGTGETSGSPVSREAYGDGAAIVLNCSGQRLRHGEGPQDDGDVRDRAVEAANRKGISGQGRLRSRSGEPCARKRASTVRRGTVGNVPQGNALAVYPTVMHLAKRYARSYQGHHILDLDDLYQEGVLGLMHAAEKFDARKGFQFSTYATYWICQAIGQAIMQASRTIRLPTTIWSASGHLVRAQAALWQQEQREPSPDELAEVMWCEKEHVLLLLQLQHEPVSLEQPAYSEEEVTLVGDQIAASDDTEQRERQQEVAELLAHLNPQERRVIQTRYQVGGAPADSVEEVPLPYTVVGRRLGMTDTLVKAMEARAFIKMRFWAARGNVITREAEQSVTIPAYRAGARRRAKREGMQKPGTNIQQR